MKKYYVYAYIRLDTNTYFYIGKGCGNRAYNESKRNNHFLKILRKTDVCVEILSNNLSNTQAFRLEREVIESLVFEEGYSIEIKGISRNKTNHLVNRTWGGDGASGMSYHHSKESRQKISKSHKGKKLSQETKQKLRAANLGRINGPHKEETRIKISESHKNKKFSKEWRENLSKSHIGLISPRRKAVYCIELNEYFDSGDLAIREMRKRYGISCIKLKEVCNGKRKTAGKLSDGTRLHWVWADNYTPATTE